MRSFLVAIAIAVLGLVYTINAQTCSIKCETTSNSTQQWENGVEIQFGADVTITVSKTEQVLVIVNQKSKLVVVIDTKNTLILVYRFEAKFGLAINYKTGSTVKVTLDIQLVIKGDFTALRGALDKADSDIKAGGKAVFKFVFSYTQNVKFDIKTCIETSNTELRAEIEASYTVVLKGCWDVGEKVGRSVNLIGAIVSVGFGSVTSVVLEVVNSIQATIEVGAQISYNVCIVFVQSIQTASVKVLVAFQATIRISISNVDQAIADAQSGVNIDRTIGVGSFKFHFVIVLVKDYIQFAFDLGNIHVDIAYSDKALSINNVRANIIYVLYKQYTFIYFFNGETGILIKGDNCIFITASTILKGIGSNKSIGTGTLAVYVSDNADTAFSSATKITLKDLKAALESQAKFEALLKANGVVVVKIDVFYKAVANYARSISPPLVPGIGHYKFDLSISIRVTVSVNADSSVDQSCYNNLIVSGLSTALGGAQSVGSATALFNSFKLVFGSSSSG